MSRKHDALPREYTHDFDRCDRERDALSALYKAVVAMVEEGSDGRIYFKTANGIPMAMPKRMERLARKGLNAVEAIDEPGLETPRA